LQIVKKKNATLSKKAHTTRSSYRSTDSRAARSNTARLNSPQTLPATCSTPPTLKANYAPLHGISYLAFHAVAILITSIVTQIGLSGVEHSLA